MPLTTAGQNAVGDEIFSLGSGTFPLAEAWISLHSADPGLTGANEVTGGSPAYARKQNTFPAFASGTADNDTAILFDVPAGDVVGWGVWDLATAGVCFQTGWFSTVSNAILVPDADVAGNLIRSHEHGFAANDRVVFEVLEGLTVPAGLAVGPATIYHVIATGLTADAFSVSATQGGAAIDITASGVAIVRKVVVTNYGAQGQFQINAGEFDVFGN
jgi:hypothetical protein